MIQGGCSVGYLLPTTLSIVLMAKRRNLKKEKQERNRSYARKFKKRKLRNDGRGEGAGNGVTGTASNGGAAD